jgi:hypothetical protein
MSDQDQLRTRAERLLAMARKAREEGHLDCAERFTQRASEILDTPKSGSATSQKFSVPDRDVTSPAWRRRGPRTL